MAQLTLSNTWGYTDYKKFEKILSGKQTIGLNKWLQLPQNLIQKVVKLLKLKMM